MTENALVERHRKCNSEKEFYHLGWAHKWEFSMKESLQTLVAMRRKEWDRSKSIKCFKTKHSSLILLNQALNPGLAMGWPQCPAQTAVSLTKQKNLLFFLIWNQKLKFIIKNFNVIYRQTLYIDLEKALSFYKRSIDYLC